MIQKYAKCYCTIMLFLIHLIIRKQHFYSIYKTNNIQFYAGFYSLRLKVWNTYNAILISKVCSTKLTMKKTTTVVNLSVRDNDFSHLSYSFVMSSLSTL